LCAEQAKFIKQLAGQADERQNFNQMGRNRMSYANLHEFQISEEDEPVQKQKYSPIEFRHSSSLEQNSNEKNELVHGQYPLNVKFVKWQDSKIGEYIEFKIIVFY
jgi:hypothetical protein